MRHGRQLLLALVVLTAACRDQTTTEPSAHREIVSLTPSKSAGLNEIAGEWVIQMKQGTSSPLTVVTNLLQQVGGSMKSNHLEFAGAVVATMSESAAQTVRNDSRVRSVTPNAQVRLWGTQTPAPWALDRIDQRQLPLSGSFTYPADGQGAHIYIFDTGINYLHPDFNGRATGDISVVGDNLGALDGCGHGSAVAGIAGSSTYGVAKAARIHAVKVIDRSCWGDVTSLLNGLTWIRDNHVKPAVINSSLGFSGKIPAIDSAVKVLINTYGITWVQAAGNDGTDACLSSPSSVREGIVVAAVDWFDLRAAWSNVGDCVDLYAPGIDLETTYYDYWNNPTDYSARAFLSGTSASAPLVAGVAATYLGKNPLATPAQVQQFIVGSATSGVVQYPGLGTPNRLLHQASGGITSVSIAGPSAVRPTSSCTWFASVSGGAAPLSYTWLVNGSVAQLSGTTFTYQLSTSSTITLVVRDAYQSTQQASRSITVSATAKATCPS